MVKKYNIEEYNIGAIVELLAMIANELAESNRLRRIQLQLEFECTGVTDEAT